MCQFHRYKREDKQIWLIIFVGLKVHNLKVDDLELDMSPKPSGPAKDNGKE